MSQPLMAQQSCNSSWPRSKSNGYFSTTKCEKWSTTIKFWIQETTQISQHCFIRSIQPWRKYCTNLSSTHARITATTSGTNNNKITLWTRIWSRLPMIRHSLWWPTFCSSWIIRLRCRSWVAEAEMEDTREAMKRSTYSRSRSSS